MRRTPRTILHTHTHKQLARRNMIINFPRVISMNMQDIIHSTRVIRCDYTWRVATIFYSGFSSWKRNPHLKYADINRCREVKINKRIANYVSTFRTKHRILLHIAIRFILFLTLPQQYGFIFHFFASLLRHFESRCNCLPQTFIFTKFILREGI